MVQVEAHKGKAMRVWIDDLSNLAEATKNTYEFNFQRFLDRFEVSPDELYEMRRRDLENEDPRDHQSIERMVKVLMSEMKQSGKSASTCRQVSKAASSFFESQGMPLKLRAKDHPKGMSNGQRLAMGDDIRLMWDYSSTEFKLRNRAAIAFLKDSGLRISDVNNLNVEDWLRAETVKVNGEDFKIFMPVETKKTKSPAYPIIGPEAINAIDAYLEERRETGVTMDPNSPLFVNREGRRFHSDGFGHIFQYLGKKTGKRISAHSLRKFHTTMLQSAGLSDSWIKRLQGKVIGGSMGPYSLPQETGELLEAYVKAYPKLRLFGPSDNKIEEQADIIKNQANRIRELEAKLAESSISQQSLQNDVDQLKQNFQNIVRMLQEMKEKRE